MNFKHLHYFWVTARAGGIVRAGQQLHTTPQTLSGQIKLLESRLGKALFRRRGRNLELTEDGRIALGYADEIFALGGELEAALRGDSRGAQKVVEFSVGIVDSLPKSLAYRLMQPALDLPERVRLVCHEGKFDQLLGQLAVHKLDLVLADEPLPRHISVKAFNHPLGRTEMSFMAAAALIASGGAGPARGARRPRAPAARFPQGLEGLPFLMPGPESPMRRQLDAWLTRHDLHPRIVGEFDDSALVKAFGRAGRGVFVVPRVLEAEVQSQYDVQVLGRSDELHQEFFAISVERRITHPGVAAVTEAARDRLFGA